MVLRDSVNARVSPNRGNVSLSRENESIFNSVRSVASYRQVRAEGCLVADCLDDRLG